MKSHRGVAAAIIAVTALALGACSEQINMLKARRAFQDANVQYTNKEYQAAIHEYERVLELDPNGDPRVIIPTHFYLGSSHHLLFRPTSREPDNLAHMDEAIKHYTIALEQAEPGDPTRQYALEQLAAIYRDVKNDFPTAETYYLELIALSPESPERYYTLGDLYERFHEPERLPLLDKAIEAYQRPVSMNPQDPVAYRHVAAVLNRYGRFDETIEWLQMAKEARTTDAEGYYLIATHYWDKVYRDPDLTAEQRREFTALGIDELDAALEINPEYVDAMVYKGLLLREQAKLEPNAATRAELEAQANELRDKAMALKAAQEEAAAMAEAAGEAPAEGTTH
jgi:tetratricopeptide (TPR) repeat protein